MIVGTLFLLQLTLLLLCKSFHKRLLFEITIIIHKKYLVQDVNLEMLLIYFIYKSLDDILFDNSN